MSSAAISCTARMREQIVLSARRQLLNLFDKSHEWFTNPSLKMSTAQAENYLMGGADRSEHQCTRQSWPVRLGEMYCPCYIKTGLLSVVLL